MGDKLKIINFLAAMISRVANSPESSYKYSQCANRHSITVTAPNAEYTIMSRETDLPDSYSREEILEMLTLIRKHEKLMDWKCPEPEGV